jgi:hypothetical protein
VGDVVRLPVAAPPTPVHTATWDVDDWGRDDTLVRLGARLLGLRWKTSIDGAQHLPAAGPGLIVTNARPLMLTPWHVAIVLSRHLGRPLRFVGRPDAAPAGALARRLGGLLARPDEVAAALRDGELLVYGAAGTLDPRQVGDVDHRIVGVAVRTGAPVFPAAVGVSPVGRAARIDVGGAVSPPRRRRGPFAELELAERLRVALVEALETSGTPRTGTPLDWLPVGISGGR